MYMAANIDGGAVFEFKSLCAYMRAGLQIFRRCAGGVSQLNAAARRRAEATVSPPLMAFCASRRYQCWNHDTCDGHLNVGSARHAICGTRNAATLKFRLIFYRRTEYRRSLQ